LSSGIIVWSNVVDRVDQHVQNVCKREQPALAISLIHTRMPFNLVWQFLRFQLLDDEAARAKTAPAGLIRVKLLPGFHHVSTAVARLDIA
jgi:hypothetical protein